MPDPEWTDVHHANHHYGHAHIMARYGGLDPERPPRIPGYLQHGWNIGDGLAPGTPYVAGSPIYFWSEQTRRRSQALGRPNTVVVGAPWLYLLTLEPALGTAPEREGTIWYPFHGWEGQRVTGDHQRQIALIRDVEPDPVTVCLYWQEFQTPPIRQVYERAGFRVICHGMRGHWWRGTDSRFLYKQLAELRRHRRVASNRLSSAVLYGISVGCEPAVYGDPMVLRDEDPTFGGVARIRRQWPELHGENVDIDIARAIAADELGADHIMSAPELRAVFSWSAMPSATPAELRAAVG